MTENPTGSQAPKKNYKNLVIGLIAVFLIAYLFEDGLKGLKLFFNDVGQGLEKENTKRDNKSKTTTEYYKKTEKKLTNDEILANSLLDKFKTAMDVSNPTTRNFSVKLAAEFQGPFNIDQLCNVYDKVSGNWKYVNDPRGLEYVAKASESIENNLAGDCDDFAVLMASAIKSIGGKTRIVTAWNEKNVGHAYAEVRVGYKKTINEIYKYINNHYTDFFWQELGVNNVESIYYDTDSEDRAWLNLDWNSKYPGGPFFKSVKRIFFYPDEDKYEIEENQAM